MARTLKTISPVDGSVYVERPLATSDQIERTLVAAQRTQCAWRRTSIDRRAELMTDFVNAMLEKRETIAEELTWQMGRPIAHTPGELDGFEERARHMILTAEPALADISPGERPGFKRFIRREPLGVVFVIAPWNYPLLTAVNAVVPALMAGNAVVLKHSAQTPLVAEQFYEAGLAAELPEGLLHYLHLDHEQVANIIGDSRIAHVAFTGSVEGGLAVRRAASERFIATGLELGGKDAAYLRADAPLEHSIETVVDGGFYNAGQSCCGIERVYVHERIFDDVIDRITSAVKRYRLDTPLDPDTTLGPLARASAATAVRNQVQAAISAGAQPLIDEKTFPRSSPGTPYLAPQVLISVNHEMEIMREETFGPVIGVMRVRSDDEAIQLMNDNRYGLSCAVFTRDVDAALAIGERVETGTWFMNRCDYLDPGLAWVGVKDSGRGCTLSRVGYEHLTRPKSFHLRTEI